MSRYTDRDSDEERLPEHFKRIGYDEDTQKYTFEDTSTGRIYESAPGSRYGVLNPVGQPQEPAEIEAHNVQVKRGNRESIRMMLPFALLVLVFLLLLFRFLNSGSEADKEAWRDCGPNAKVSWVKKGDTCWEIAKAHGVAVDELLAIPSNVAIDCYKLWAGQTICVPE